MHERKLWIVPVKRHKDFLIRRRHRVTDTAPRERLPQHENIRRDFVRDVTIPGASHSRRNFVEDEQNAEFVAKLARSTQELDIVKLQSPGALQKRFHNKGI